MKKNLVFKLGLFCAALVLVATCFVTNAWAKYTRSVSATDSARVAHFEVTLNEKSDAEFEHVAFDVFSTKFKNIMDDGGADFNNGSKLLAPGSSGSFSITVNSNSEVAVKFDFKVTTEENANSIPLVWTIDVVDTDSDGNPDEFSTLTAAFNAISGKVFAAGTNTAETYTVNWKWAYEGGDDDADTTLGEAGTAVYNVAFTISATQVEPVLVP